MNTVISTTGETTTAVAAISARGLRKSFGEKTVLDGIDLTVPQGTILALLGPNGAGKTTAVHLLTTYLRALEVARYLEGCGYGEADNRAAKAARRKERAGRISGRAMTHLSLRAASQRQPDRPGRAGGLRVRGRSAGVMS
jgi:ABC-type branched-subunit amino acid transport system ATPase component